MKKNLLKLLTLSIFAIATFTLTSCDPDPCKDVVCADTGGCIDGTCFCDAGYSGSDCSILLKTAYIGVYNAVEVCTSDTSYIDNFTAEVRESATGADAIILTNIFNLGSQGFDPSDASVVAQVSDNGILIPTQFFTANLLDSVQVSGTGTVLTGTSFTIDYTIVDTGWRQLTDNCSTTYTLQ